MILTRIKAPLLIGISAIFCIGIWFFPIIAQDPNYHDFADNRDWLGVANFGNVISNFPFALIGLLGLRHLLHQRPKSIPFTLLPAYIIFFGGVFLVCFGSAYYHLSPDNERLVWDRLPMTLAFMALFSIIVSKRINLQFGKTLLWSLLPVGLLSIFYWQYTEQYGEGDLRLYALVQFLPMLLIPLILWLYPSRHDDTRYLLCVLFAYGLSKVTEFFDANLLSMFGTFSGHSVKHLLASLAVFFFYLKILRAKREPPTGYN